MSLNDPDHKVGSTSFLDVQLKHYSLGPGTGRGQVTSHRCLVPGEIAGLTSWSSAQYSGLRT